MAKEGKSNGHVLDLTSTQAVNIAKATKEIELAYAGDFREETFTPKKTPETLMHNNSLEVHIGAPMLDEDSYKEKLATYKERVDVGSFPCSGLA